VRIINKYIDFISKERFLIGPSLARIGIGMIMLSYYLIHYYQRHFLFSDAGLISNEFFINIFNIYTISNDPYYFEIVYHAGIVIALLFVLGFKTRIMSLLNIIFFTSISSRNFLIGDGGDNLLLVCLVFFVFMDMSRYFSLDTYIRKRKKKVKSVEKNKFLHSVGSIVHNHAVVICIIQLAILYFVSGSYQIVGDYWNSGVALYYIFQVDEYTRGVFSDIIINSNVLLVVATYFSIIIKIAFPFALFNKYLKYVVVSALIAFHVGIAIEMGLVTFSLIMILFELFVFTDKEYLNMFRVYNWFKNKVSLIFKNRLLNRTTTFEEKDSSIS